MSDLKAQFEKAILDSNALPEKPDTEDQLFLYSHFKQSSVGDCTGDRPGLTNFVARSKFDAWQKLSGMSKDEAMQKYIDKVNSLKG